MPADWAKWVPIIRARLVAEPMVPIHIGAAFWFFASSSVIPTALLAGDADIAHTFRAALGASLLMAVRAGIPVTLWAILSAP